MTDGRLIINKDLSSADGLAIDEALCESVGAGHVPPTLHLYNYTPCVILGRYQNAAASLRLDRCHAHGVGVNRRISGGGTVFMTPGQMAFALVLPNAFPGLPPSITGSFRFLAAAFARALSVFGLHAEFMGKNDLTVNGRKIAGLAISQDFDGVTFFHTSLLLDFDVPLMLDLLNLPTRNMLDRGISCFGERMTTIRDESGKNISLHEVIEAVRSGVSEVLEIPLPVAELSLREQERVAELKRLKYENEEWIYHVRAPRRRTGFAQRKTPGGLIQAHLALSGGVIETIVITGDYFSRGRDVAQIESVLRWTSPRREALEQAVAGIPATDLIHLVDLPVILDLIVEAAAASEKENGTASQAAPSSKTF